MNIVHGMGFFSGLGAARPRAVDFLNPIALGIPIAILGQNAPTAAPEPMQLPIPVASEWADKIDLYMKQVQAIQDYVKAHPEAAQASGLAKDAAALPASGDLAAWPKMKDLYDALRAGHPVLESDLDLVPALGVALISANQKLPPDGGLTLSPIQVGIGAGILALAVGVVVLS